jgi:3-hydroxybutyrate dehydrogenase
VSKPLSGKRALITGSAQGLGLAIATRLAADGCDVVIHGLADASTLEALCGRFERDHAVRAMSSNADLRSPAEIGELMSAVERSFGGVDILVNNAVARHNAPVDAFPTASWDESLAVNLSAAFHTIHLAVPTMKKNKWGRIVNVSSIYGLRGAANRVGYVTTKTALIGLTRAVALETATDGITCNAVCPGTTESPVHNEAIARLIVAEGLSPVAAELQLLAGKQPTHRLISAQGVAAFVAFLCSDQAADITGATLPIDAGWGAG